MHKFPEIPITQVGPGSQSRPEDELEYMEMPHDMHTFRNPVLPEPEEVENLVPGKKMLESIITALYSYDARGDVFAMDLGHLDATNLDFVNQALGEGEVSVSYDNPSPIRAQESVLAGVWRVQHFDNDDNIIRDTIEVGSVPSIVLNGSFAEAGDTLDTDYDHDNPMIQNAPALLVELSDKLREYQPGDEVHTINLSLLPITEADLLLLGERLGVGPITILSRGYGNCRIGSTAYKNVWWIKYFNSQDVLILNTIEVVDVPAVACAAREDIQDSRQRLDEIMALYR